MRCKACDADLKDHETRRKGLWTGEFIDLCDPCFETIADDVSLSTGDEDADADIRDDYDTIFPEEVQDRL